jgi:uncharacterized membrane protein
VGMKKIIFVFLIVFYVGCGFDPVDLDGRLVKDVNGKIYEIEENIMDTYFIREYVQTHDDYDDLTSERAIENAL